MRLVAAGLAEELGVETLDSLALMRLAQGHILVRLVESGGSAPSVQQAGDADRFHLVHFLPMAETGRGRGPSAPRLPVRLLYSIYHPSRTHDRHPCYKIGGIFWHL